MLEKAIPKRLGRFEVFEVIGEGSFAYVVRAYDANLRRDVAIKIPRSNLKAQATERFLREGKRCSQIRSQFVVQVHESDVDTDSQLPYIVMECVSGVNIQEWTIAISSNEIEIARIFADVVRGILAAHRQGVIHRDLKPGNILVSLDGEVRVSDFGLAISVDLDDTIEEGSAGTISYMSPEQARLLECEIDSRSDIFSLGVVLFELLAGSKPIQASTAVEYLLRLKEKKFLTLRQVKPQASPILELICRRCLQFEPELRYQNCEELLEDLECFVNGKSPRNLSASLATRVLVSCRTNADWFGAIAGWLILVSLVSVGFWEWRQDFMLQGSLNHLVNCPVSELPAAIQEVTSFGERGTEKIEISLSFNSNPKNYRLFMALCRLEPATDTYFPKFLEDLPDIEEKEFIRSLDLLPDRGQQMLRNEFASLRKRYDETGLDSVRTSLARLGILLAYCGDVSGIQELCREDDDLSDRYELFSEWARRDISLSDVAETDLRNAKAEVRSTIATVYGLRQRRDARNANEHRMNLTLAEWCKDNDSAVFAAAMWALKTRPMSSQGFLPTDSRTREWFVSESGVEFCLKPNGSNNFDGTPKFWVSMKEVSLELLGSFDPNLKGRLHKLMPTSRPDDSKSAAALLSPIDAMQFCNWLSQKDMREPCYSIHGDTFSIDVDRSGYRLLRIEEWESLIRPSPKTEYFTGNSFDVLKHYSSIDSKEVQIGLARFPPINGFFDVYGNVAEICHDGENFVSVGGAFQGSNSTWKVGASSRIDNLKQRRIQQGLRLITNSYPEIQN